MISLYFFGAFARFGHFYVSHCHDTVKWLRLHELYYIGALSLYSFEHERAIITAHTDCRASFMTTRYAHNDH